MLYDMMRDRIYCWYSNNQNFLLNYVSGICLLSFSFFFFFWLLKTIDNNDILVINVNDPRMQVIHNFIIIEDKTRHDIVVVVNWFLEFLLCMDLLLFCKKKTPLFQFIRTLHVDLVIDQNGNHNIWLILLIVTTVDFDFDSLVL